MCSTGIAGSFFFPFLSSVLQTPSRQILFQRGIVCARAVSTKMAIGTSLIVRPSVGFSSYQTAASFISGGCDK